MADDDARSNGQSGKVARVIETYELDGMDELLARSWRGEGEPKRSLRELADYCNREILASVMNDAGMEALEGELDNIYRLMTAEDVTSAARTQAETRLSRAGVDVESLRSDFVSHQAVHTYLRKVRDVDPPSKRDSPEESIEKRTETIQRLRNRLIAVAEQSLQTLRDASYLSLGSFDVFVGVSVHCNDCSTTHDIVELLDGRGCDCQRS